MPSHLLAVIAFFGLKVVLAVHVYTEFTVKVALVNFLDIQIVCAYWTAFLLGAGTR